VNVIVANLNIGAVITEEELKSGLSAKTNKPSDGLLSPKEGLAVPPVLSLITVDLWVSTEVSKLRGSWMLFIPTKGKLLL